MNGGELLAYWVCRSEVCALVPRDDLTYTERSTIGDTLQACGEFLVQISEYLHLQMEFLKPWHTGRKTVAEARTQAHAMLEEVKTTVRGPAYAQVDVIMDRYYRAADSKYKQRIRNHYLKILQGN